MGQDSYRFCPNCRLVLETLSPLPEDRKCFRMINGVLVERTVKDVLPALETNSVGLKKVLDGLVKQYKRQQEEMEKWKVGAMPSQHFLPSKTCDRARTSAAANKKIMRFMTKANDLGTLEKEQHTSCSAIRRPMTTIGADKAGIASCIRTFRSPGVPKPTCLQRRCDITHDAFASGNILI